MKGTQGRSEWEGLSRQHWHRGSLDKLPSTQQQVPPVMAGESRPQTSVGGFCPDRGQLPWGAACPAAGLAELGSQRQSRPCRFLEWSETFSNVPARRSRPHASGGADCWCQ